MADQIYENTGINKKVIDEICDLAEKYRVQWVKLFGSRARGEFRERSDIDLAVYGGNTGMFALAVEEETSTLLKFDVVDMGASVQQELLDSIEREGIVIYEKI